MNFTKAKINMKSYIVMKTIIRYKSIQRACKPNLYIQKNTQKKQRQNRNYKKNNKISMHLYW